METKKSNTSILNLFAFVALIALAILEVLTGLDGIGVTIFGTGSVIISLLNTIKNVCVVIVIGILAYNFVAGKSKGFKIAYWICVVIFIAATVLMWF